jgi:hypothetical protein
VNSVYVTYLLPALVIAASVIVALVIRRRRRRSAAVLEHSNRIAGEALIPAPPDPAAESAWRKLHAAALESWMSTHEERLDRVSADGFTNAEAALEQPDSVGTDHLDIVVAAHPNPHRRAEFSALLAAARSTLSAVARADYAGARRHHLVYRDYKDIWRRHEHATDDDRS